LIRLSGVSFSYAPGEPVLAGVDLELGPGLSMVVGVNGCGKSTLLKLAAGVERPDAGSIEIGGYDLWREEVEARRHLAYVPEQPDLTPYATVREILQLVCRLRGEPPARVGTVLAGAGLERCAGRSVRELSMGQRRRAVLAAARIGRPRCLLLDEPLEALDLGAREDLLAWIDSRLADGATVVAVAHDLEPFAQQAHHALTLSGGRAHFLASLPRDPAPRRDLFERLARGQLPAPIK
jgi:ABC-type multidrug transport system ATPase subunit